MSATQRPAFNFGPLVNFDYKGIFSEACALGTSSSLSSITLSTVRNLPYVLSKEITVITFLSSRQNYLEATGNAALSTVVNLAAAFFYSALYGASSFVNLVTSEYSTFHKEAATECKKNWVTTASSLLSVFVGTIGIVSPMVGAISYLVQIGLVATVAGYFIGDNTMNETLRMIKDLYTANRQWLESHSQNNSDHLKMLKLIDDKLPTVTNFKELFELLN